MKDRLAKIYRSILQHWLYLDSSIDKWTILDYVLPDHKKISEAPLNLEDVPGYSQDFSLVELERFKAKALAAERGRKYKVMDADGNIYLVGNPWARQLATRKDGTVWVMHPKPRRIMTYAQAKRVAVRRLIDLSRKASESSEDEQRTDTE